MQTLAKGANEIRKATNCFCGKIIKRDFGLIFRHNIFELAKSQLNSDI